jgi:tellurite resistance protein TerC
MLWIWAGFLAFVLAMLALDLGVFHRHAHIVSIREAMGWSAVWVTIGLLFSIFVYFGYENQWMGLGTAVDVSDGVINDGRSAALKYVTGYVIEKSLSVDNIFVIAMIFTFFGVPSVYQHRVLFWGVLGALVMRGVMIGAGAVLIARFHWILYIFGVFLILTGIKMLFAKTESIHPERNILVRLVRQFMPVTNHFHGQHFLVRAGSNAAHEGVMPGTVARDDDPAMAHVSPGTWMLTPLAVALIMVETADLVFAVDSIPAIFAITADPFLVFTSNVFAILGLRSLYFVLAGMLDRFRYLKLSLSLVLILVGIKMLIAKQLKAVMGEYSGLYLLALVFIILAAGIVVSWVESRDQQKSSAS